MSCYNILNEVFKNKGAKLLLFVIGLDFLLFGII